MAATFISALHTERFGRCREPAVAMIALTIIRFNQTTFLEVKDLSSSPFSKTSSASSCESDFPKNSPRYFRYFYVMAISFVYKGQSYVMFS